MASYYNSRASITIPITYVCSECGKTNFDVSVISTTASVRATLSGNNSSRASEIAKEKLHSKYVDVFNEVNSKHKCGNITSVGKCTCGCIQPWATGKLRIIIEKGRWITIGLIFLLMLGVTIFDGVLDDMSIGVAMLLGSLVISFFGGNLLYNILEYIMKFVYYGISALGVAKMKANGKEAYLPKIIREQ